MSYPAKCFVLKYRVDILENKNILEIHSKCRLRICSFYLDPDMNLGVPNGRKSMEITPIF